MTGIFVRFAVSIPARFCHRSVRFGPKGLQTWPPRSKNCSTRFASSKRWPLSTKIYRVFPGASRLARSSSVAAINCDVKPNNFSNRLTRPKPRAGVLGRPFCVDFLGAISSVGRAPCLHRGCRGFESLIAHSQSENPRNSEGFCILGDSVRLKITACRREVRRFLRRFFKMRIEHRQVVLASNRLRVAEPLADDMRWEVLFGSVLF